MARPDGFGEGLREEVTPSTLKDEYSCSEGKQEQTFQAEGHAGTKACEWMSNFVSQETLILLVSLEPQSSGMPVLQKGMWVGRSEIISLLWPLHKPVAIATQLSQ